MFVLDTNTVIDYFRGKGRVAERLLSVPPSEIGLPSIAAYEAWVGVLGSKNAVKRQAQFEEFLATIEILPFDAAMSRLAATIRLALARRGEIIGPMDTLIAATALEMDATLVTRNVTEFGRVPKLIVANWHD
ncbi:MAG: type II toxin-antitoxin system VapC family toxin [Burkholderiales bacterium]|nr:type II toxin-antitoxin system VapC family toxin [Burkholderiales bacterium]